MVKTTPLLLTVKRVKTCERIKTLINMDSELIKGLLISKLDTNGLLQLASIFLEVNLLEKAATCYLKGEAMFEI